VSQPILVRPRPRAPLREHLVRSAAGRLFAAYWGSLVVVDLTRGLGDVVGLLALLTLAVLCSTRQGPLVSAGVAATVWLFLTGFVVNSYGLLALSGPADAVRLGVLVLAAIVTARITRRPGATR